MFSKCFQETPQNHWGYSIFCKPMRLTRLLHLIMKMPFIIYYYTEWVKVKGERKKAAYRLNSTLTSVIG